MIYCVHSDPVTPDDFLAHFHQGAYEAGYDAALDDARRWGWRRPDRTLLVAVGVVAFIAGIVIGYWLSVSAVKAATLRGGSEVDAPVTARADYGGLPAARPQGRPGAPLNTGHAGRLGAMRRAALEGNGK